MKRTKNVKEHKERRLVTILFADLSGFTAFSQELDPEELSDAINICFEQLNRIIAKHGGTIHKYEGDLVIAIFGLPQAHEDDPERSIKAALEMMDHMSEINKILTSKLKTTCDLGLHAGINLGTVFASEIGSREKKEYTIIGEAVNLASRLKDAAKCSEILVSGRIFRQTRYLFDYEPLPPITVKGISKPVTVFKPTKIKEKPEPKRGIKGLYSSLVGRNKELEFLKLKIEVLCKEKDFGVTFVLGEAGIGKSRLLEELKTYITSSKMPITVLEGRCLSYGETLTYFPLLGILKQLLHITDEDSLKTIQKKILKKITSLLPDIYKEVVPYINYLFSIPLSSEYAEKIKYLDAESLKIQVCVALRNLLVAASKQTPLLLIFEDYHWIDASSLELLGSIFDFSEPIPLLVLCSSRPEKESIGFQSKKCIQESLGDSYSEIILKPLDAEASCKLADNLLSISGLPTRIKDQLLSKAEGNPFYLEEIFRSLIDHGYLIYESGTWKPTPQFSIPDIPDTIQEIIFARLDQLDSDLKDLLQQASAIGRSFLVHILEYITKIDSLMMSLYLATLEEFEYIRLLTKDPKLEYIFKHPLMQEVIYNSLPKKNRRELHRQIAETIEQLQHDRLEEFTEMLAHHYSYSNDYDKAVEWLKKGGERAKERYANEEAIKYYQNLISISDKIASRQTATLVRQESYEALGDIFSLQGEYTKAIENFDEVYRISEDMITLSTARRKKANVFFHQSKYDDALKILNEAKKNITEKSPVASLELSEIYLLRGSIYEVKGLSTEAQKEIERALGSIERVKPDDQFKTIKAKGFINLASILRSQGEYDQAIEMYKKGKKLWEELNNKRGLANTTNHLGIIYHLKGDYKKAIKFNKEGLTILEEIGDKKGFANASGSLGVMYSYLGDYTKALEYHQKNYKISEEIGDRRGIGIASSNLAKIYLMQGDHKQAQAYFQKYLDISEQIGDKAGTSAALGNLAILFLKTNKLDQAEEYLLRTEKILKELGNKQLLMTAYSYLAEVQLLRKVSLGKALEFTDKAWSLAEEIDSKPGRAECYHMYSKIYGSMKEYPKAEENLQKAAEIFTEIGRTKEVISVYNEFAQILKNVGQTKKADIYFKRADEIEGN